MSSKLSSLMGWTLVQPQHYRDPRLPEMKTPPYEIRGADERHAESSQRQHLSWDTAPCRSIHNAILQRKDSIQLTSLCIAIQCLLWRLFLVH